MLHATTKESQISWRKRCYNNKYATAEFIEICIED